jgi:hypothetical protein
MVGTPVIAAAVGLWPFWILVAVGLARGDLSLRGAGLILALWLVGRVALGDALAGTLFPPYVAVLDVVFVFVIFKGDVRLT